MEANRVAFVAGFISVLSLLIVFDFSRGGLEFSSSQVVQSKPNNNLQSKPNNNLQGLYPLLSFNSCFLFLFSPSFICLFEGEIM
jgi:hypothetical protein